MKNFVTVQGTVTEINGQWFSVKIEDTEKIVLCYPAGKLRNANIRIILGDVVQVEMDPNDLSKGRISYRFRGK